MPGFGELKEYSVPLMRKLGEVEIPQKEPTLEDMQNSILLLTAVLSQLTERVKYLEVVIDQGGEDADRNTKV
jgi:hypothetical protein